jgi:hypothetical protein
MGAEYCPYCGTERWALVVALSRFGSFTGLHVIQSASDDAFPNTQTFTFHGSGYRSAYVAFDAVELETNSYTKLDQPTPEQRRLMLTYDGKPFFNPSSTGGIPFIDFGGRYLVSGASFDPGVLQGKSAESIVNESRTRPPRCRRAPSVPRTRSLRRSAGSPTTNRRPSVRTRRS